MDIRRATVLALALMGTPALAWDDDNQDNVISNGRCPGTIYANTRLGADIIALPSDPDPCINFGADFQNIVAKGISAELLKWKAIEVAHELSKSPNSRIIVLGDKSGLPLILSDK
jgi:hypothetical protein